MLSSRQYYSYINKNFIVRNKDMFKNCQIKFLSCMPLPDGVFDQLLSVLDVVQSKYGFDMQKMCLPNYNKFLVWQKNNSGKVNYQEMLVAIEFIVFCCLADKILDSQRFSDAEKEKVCQKLDVGLFLSEDEFESGYFVEMDILLNNIRRFLVQENIKKHPYYRIIEEKMEKAFKSEKYMSKNFLKPVEKMKMEEMPLLIDKSVEFEIVAFLLGVFSDISEDALVISKCIANIFWLVDDLCDFVEDIKFKRKNSVLFFCTKMDMEMSLTDRVEMAYENIDLFINELEKNLYNLETLSGRDLFDYILNEVWEWFTDVRKRVGL